MSRRPRWSEGPRRRRSVAGPNSEHAHQVALIKRARLHEHVWPQLKNLVAIPNGGKRNAVTAALLKAEGAQAGVSDLGLFAPVGQYHGLWLELKVPSRAREGIRALTDAQRDWFAQMSDAGYAVALAFGVDAGWEALRFYLSAQDEPFHLDAQVVAELVWLAVDIDRPTAVDIYRPAGWDVKRRRAA